jgi:hypothetical protein
MGMDLGKCVRAHLRAQAGITALVGSYGIYPKVIPQDASLPAITYQQVSRVPNHAMSADPKLQMYRLQLSCFSTSYSQAKAVAKQTLAALRDYKGSVSGLLGDGTSGINVQRIFFDGEIDMMATVPGTVSNVQHIVQDFLVWAST